MERSIEPKVPHCCLSQMCSSNQPAGWWAGHRGMNCWENSYAQHCTSLGLQEYLELADCTQSVFSSTGFLFIETFLLPPFCHFRDFNRYLHESFLGGSLSWMLRKIGKRPTQPGLECTKPHSLHTSIPPSTCYLRGCRRPGHPHCPEDLR